MAAAKKTKASKARARRRVWVKPHCRRRPVSALEKKRRVDAEMPF